MKYLRSCAKSVLLVGLPLLSVWYLWLGYKVAPALLFLSAFALIVTPNVRGLRLKNGRLNAAIESNGGVIGKLRSSQSPEVPLEAQAFLGLEIRERPPKPLLLFSNSQTACGCSSACGPYRPFRPHSLARARYRRAALPS
jgi:hypothetical protein